MDWQTVSQKMLEIYNSHGDLHRQLTKFWHDNILFTWRWWLMAALLILPWVFWFIVRKKESAGRLLQAGLFAGLTATVLDGFGISMGLWHYPAPLLPVIPDISFNLSVLPVVTMLTVQFFPKLKPIWKALIYGAVGAFIFEPLVESVGLYCDVLWRHYYSFPILVLIYLAADRLANGARFVPIRNI